MKKIIIVLAFIVVIAASIVYFNCPQRKLELFLTFIYTTSYDGRMDKILEAEEVNDEDINFYYATIEYITSEELLNKLVNNRIPFVYDLSYADTPYLVKTINLTKADSKGKYDYEVVCSNESSTITFTGNVRINEGKIDYFYEKSNKIN